MSNRLSAEDFKIAMHLSELQAQLDHFERLDAEHGRNEWRDKAFDAVLWALESMSERFDDAIIEKVVELNERRRARNAKREQARTQ